MDWMKSIQSVGRGLRPGSEIIVMKSRQAGKSLIMDLESNFDDWKHVLRTHYVETWVAHSKLEWVAYNRKPSLAIMYEANKVVRHNEDGSFEYLKNLDGTGVRVLDEQETKEFLFTILTATRK